ncbi:hypothetical protein F4805DRAFT_435401 [Annulohypoxylon moriforme]|nr:hypothetical protein F4805DRAFT_435401 [Annulohypoxylon moriforme]
MASNQYGSLGPLQQYNQLAFSVIPQTTHQQHSQHPQHLQHQHQPQLHQQQQHPHQQPLQQAPPHHHQQLHQPTPTTPIPPPTYQLPSSLPSSLPPTNNGVAQQQQQQQQDITPNANPTQQPPSTPTTDATIVTPTNPTPDGPQRKRRRVGRPPKSQATRDYLDQRANTNLPPAPPRPPEVHTPQPLSKGPYNTAEDAVFSLQLHVFSTGYGVSQKRTVKEKLPSGRYDPDGDVIRKDFACDRGGSEFVSQGTGERRRESKKCGCPWKAVARRLKREGDRWFLDILDARHNHPVTPPEQMHTIASYRRWQRDNNAGIRSAIDKLTRAAAMPARQVADYLKGQFADPDLDRIDKNILRALSMSDVELPSDGAAAQGSVVFDVIGRRPTIILQETPGSAGTVGDNGTGTDTKVRTSTSGLRGMGDLGGGAGVIRF